MAVVLVVIGGLGFIGPDKSNFMSSTYAIGSLLVALNFIYNCTLGPSECNIDHVPDLTDTCAKSAIH